MTGVWTQTMSRAMCPVCIAAGKPDSPLYHDAVSDGALSILQLRCHVCRFVRTSVNDATPEALKAARKVHRRGRSLVYAALAAWTIAFGILAFAAGSTFATQ